MGRVGRVSGAGWCEGPLPDEDPHRDGGHEKDPEVVVNPDSSLSLDVQSPWDQGKKRGLTSDVRS